MSKPVPAMLDPDFVRGLLAYLRYWQRQTAVLDEARIQALHSDLPNVLHTARMGLLVPETRVETAILIRQSFFLFEGTGQMVAWQALLQQALAVLPAGHNDLHFRLLLQLGQLQRSERLYETAVATLQQAYALAQQSGDARALAESHLNLGQTYQLMGQLSLAQQHGEEALARQTAVTPRLKILIQQLLGHIAMRLGNVNKARGHFEQIITLPQADRLLVASAYNNIGISYHNKDHYDEARAAYQQALAMMDGIPFHQEKLSVLLNLGAVYFAQNKLVEAEVIFRQTEQILLPQPGFLFYKALLYNNLGNVLCEQNQFLIAENYYRQSIAWYEQIEDDLYLANAQSNLGRLYKMMGCLPEAIVAYQRALVLLEPYTEQADARQWAQSYREALASLLAVGGGQPDNPG